MNAEIEFWKSYAGFVAFQPMTVQRHFMESRAKIVFGVGGNRSGKTLAGAMNAAMLLNGVKGLWYPGFPKDGSPIRAWGVALDFKVADAMRSRLRRALGKSLRRYYKKDDIFETRNGSTMEMKSEVLGYQKFQAQDIDFAWKDEIGDDKSEKIVQEVLRGLLDRNGQLVVTATPTLGTSWAGEIYYEPWAMATRGQQRPHKGVEFFFMNTEENRFLDASAVKRYADTLGTEELRRVRLRGEFVSLRGNVFSTLDPDVHVIDPIEILPEWKKYRGMDHGLHYPSTCIWVAVKPSEPYRGIHVYRELYDERKGRTIAETCAEIKRMSEGEEYVHSVLDPSCWNRHPSPEAVGGFFVIAGEYERCGVPVEKANNTVETGIERIWSLLSGEKPRLYFHAGACDKLLWEMRKLEWADGRGLSQLSGSISDNINKKCPDHAIDALRYIVMCDPTHEFGGTWPDDEDEDPEGDSLFEPYDRDDGTIGYRRKRRARSLPDGIQSTERW